MKFSELVQKNRGKRQGIQKTPIYLNDFGDAYWSDDVIDDKVEITEIPDSFTISFAGRAVTMIRYNKIRFIDDNDVKVIDDTTFLGVSDGKDFVNPREMAIEYDGTTAYVGLFDGMDEVSAHIPCSDFAEMLQKVPAYLDTICVYGPAMFTYNDKVFEPNDFSNGLQSKLQYVCSDGTDITFFGTEVHANHGNLDGYSDINPSNPTDSFIEALDNLS